MQRVKKKIEWWLESEETAYKLMGAVNRSQYGAGLADVCRALLKDIARWEKADKKERKKMKFRIHGMVEEQSYHDTTLVGRAEEGQTPQFWGVYRVDENGHEHWVADFAEQCEALAYVEEVTGDVE